MPRKRQAHALAEDGNGRLVPVPVERGGSGVPDVSSVSEGESWTASAVAALTLLCARTDGWIRIVPDSNGIALHCKYKFTSSKWPNHYVYYRVDRGHWSEAICGLYMKVARVDEGTLKPTFDTWYGEQ